MLDETAPADALEASVMVPDETPPADAPVNAFALPKASVVVLDETPPLDTRLEILAVEFCFQPPTAESMVQPPTSEPDC